MKKIFLFSVMALGVLVLFSSGAMSKSFDGKWPELEAFHKVMSQTFHPAEEGNYQPIKERIGEMVEAAAKLNSSTVPAEYNKPDIIETAKKLETDSKSLEEKIKAGATDKEIFTDLNSLHDTFHKIVGLCNTNDHNHK